jgi:hypothetical protein
MENAMKIMYVNVKMDMKEKIVHRNHQFNAQMDARIKARVIKIMEFVSAIKGMRVLIALVSKLSNQNVLMIVQIIKENA